jgi:hypothetical protein
MNQRFFVRHSALRKYAVPAAAIAFALPIRKKEPDVTVFVND